MVGRKGTDSRPKTERVREDDRQSRTATKGIDWRRWRWGLLGGVVVVGITAFVVVSQVTDASSFCGTCHEMQPYYVAWTQGNHKTQAQCIDCHVDPGFLAQLTHKFTTFSEVWGHFAGYGGFPMAAPAVVLDTRCTYCHPSVTVKSLPASFSHEQHAKQGPCQMCHPTTGHDVPAQALQAAGIYNAQNEALRARSATSTAATGAGKANIPNHVTVACSQCHDMAAMGCSACHAAPHEPRGDCQQCHPPGPTFVFQHPPTGMPDSQNIACNLCHPLSYAQVNCTCHGGGSPQGD